jgi:hypothetical protein
VIIETFRPFHVDLLIARGVQQQQLAEVSLVPRGYASLPPVPGAALSAFEDSGRIIMCGGVVPRHPGVGELWALVSQDAGRYFVALTRATRRFLQTQQLMYRRIECTSAIDFPQGCRWLGLLGFKHEGPVPGFGPNGEAHVRFGLVRS